MRLAYQNDPKHKKKLVFSKNKIFEFFGNTNWPAFPNALVIRKAKK